jgi:hypothetical protein
MNGMNQRAVLRQIRTAFQFLEEDYGMVCVWEHYNAKVFGNAIIDYEKPQLFVRVVRDRRQFSFAVGLSRSTAFSETELLRMTGAQRDLAALTENWFSIDLLAEVLNRNLNQIQEALHTDRLKALVSEKLALAAKREEFLRGIRLTRSKGKRD